MKTMIWIEDVKEIKESQEAATSQDSDNKK
jgi:hypothetical protein